MKHFGEVLNENQPLGTIYLPTASYSEMNEWVRRWRQSNHTIPFVGKLKKADLYEDNVSFVKVKASGATSSPKYPESNLLHKRMLHE